MDIQQSFESIDDVYLKLAAIDAIGHQIASQGMVSKGTMEEMKLLAGDELWKDTLPSPKSYTNIASRHQLEESLESWDLLKAVGGVLIIATIGTIISAIIKALMSSPRDKVVDRLKKHNEEMEEMRKRFNESKQKVKDSFDRVEDIKKRAEIDKIVKGDFFDVVVLTFINSLSLHNANATENKIMRILEPNGSMTKLVETGFDALAKDVKLFEERTSGMMSAMAGYSEGKIEADQLISTLDKYLSKENTQLLSRVEKVKEDFPYNNQAEGAAVIRDGVTKTREFFFNVVLDKQDHIDPKKRLKEWRVKDYHDWNKEVDKSLDSADKTMTKLEKTLSKTRESKQPMGGNVGAKMKEAEQSIRKEIQALRLQDTHIFSLLAYVTTVTNLRKHILSIQDKELTNI